MKRKMLLALPVFVFIFLTFFLFSTGLLHAEKTEAEAKTVSKGLNSSLPPATQKRDSGLNKMIYYENAKKDSVKKQEAARSDPNYKNKGEVQQVIHKVSSNTYSDPNEQKVNQKLARLREIMNQGAPSSPHRETQIETKSRQVEKASTNPEIEQLNQMMDKILEIQHPEKVAEHSKAVNLPVTIHETENSKNGFYSLNETKDEGYQNAIEAQVPETQILEAGSTVKLLVLSDLFINGFKIPKNSYIYGIASLSSERLHITISSIRYQNSILPVSLKVYDIDGLEGIYIPGSISRDIVKESSGDAIGSLGATSFDQSLGAQAAGAGIQAAKSLFSKKLKEIKVTIRQGYKILLKDTNQKL